MLIVERSVVRLQFRLCINFDFPDFRAKRVPIKYSILMLSDADFNANLDFFVAYMVFCVFLRRSSSLKRLLLPHKTQDR